VLDVFFCNEEKKLPALAFGLKVVLEIKRVIGYARLIAS